LKAEIQILGAQRRLEIFDRSRGSVGVHRQMAQSKSGFKMPGCPLGTCRPRKIAGWLIPPVPSLFPDTAATSSPRARAWACGRGWARALVVGVGGVGGGVLAARRRAGDASDDEDANGSGPVGLEEAECMCDQLGNGSLGK
jgi:hypothetical protein